jgi:5-formyltetrahydrofolate cyclo-ligase
MRMQATDKSWLRDELGHQRQSRTPGEIAAARATIRERVLARCEQEGWTSVAGYVPMRTEPGSAELLDGLRERDVRVIVPVVLADRDLDWTAWLGGTVDGSLLGVDAIALVDAVLVPALSVARDGTRLGRGGGSYDRALARVPSATILAALLYDDELVHVLPREPWDVAVTAVVMPAGWQDLAASG